MAAVSLESYRVKDVTEWSPADVREFLLTVLPGHPCADFFTYTSGYVLCSLDKEDLRRQARDDEAANVIWAELKGCRLAAAAAPGSQFEATQQRGGLAGPPTVTVYVKTRQEIAIELEVLLSDLVRSLKAQIEQREGTPLEHQRLICNGMNMQDSRSLISYGIRHGSDPTCAADFWTLLISARQNTDLRTKRHDDGAWQQGMAAIKHTETLHACTLHGRIAKLPCQPGVWQHR